MKVFTMVDDWLGMVFHRVDKAYHDWAPSTVQWVDTPEEADVQIVHILGKGELKNIKNPNYIVIQSCYHTQDIPPTDDGLRPLWENAILVVSFHDLPSYQPNWDFRFHGMPFGADDCVFFPTPRSRSRAKAVLSTGHISSTESLEELFTACVETGYKMAHLGADFGWDTDTFKHYENLSDEDVRVLYNTVNYTSCLRRIEGFELPAIEGLLCGARPITFSLSTYRWYHKYAVVIEDTNSRDITESLIHVLKGNIGLPVTDEEIEEVRQAFSWSVLIPEFWNAIEEAMEWKGRK